ncbi:uncharacterized protein BBA_06356 [Beauveria bassiana ARSEF 2860]|uniref:RGS domain-containing protein n=1 Tax=Beauveria bassiana (strain ARSEF 2860) TaxID=655819 RepID=J4UKM3_BEAB2|nr:uncharacterized protein BBA_06356 [Beauveria bassiana ARSEF 2860]EJP64787.1 hypothetical protein BBA_06356 [Beauveria bassiana ARSEF 2860]
MGSELGVTPDSKPRPNVDAVGIWWACWAGIWTAIVVCGMAFLIRKRHLPMIRMRGLGLSLTAITLLHLYWISGQLGYIIGAMAPPDAEYWIMGTYFPFGIALFHASNTRFLHVAKRQEKFATNGNSRSSSGGGGMKQKAGPGLINKLRRLDYTSKMLILVSIGMLFQLFLTIFMYLISRKFHPSFGIPGTEVGGTEMERKAAMGRGWEWWPTCFWQLTWAWVIAPIILWKSRHIKDTHGWRLQTIGCTIANLPATPMWIIAMYVPAMEAVNKYFVPPQWICLAIIFMEIFTIFVPCWEILRCQRLQKETLNHIAQWESKNRGKAVKGVRSLASSGDSTIVESILTGRKSAAGSYSSSSDESILTMSALEYVLERNPIPLQQYSALREFSGENIAFLTSVSEWKSSFPSSIRTSQYPSSDTNMRELVRERFNRALRIYAQFVSRQDAEFPINISSMQQKKLAAVFEAPTRLLYGEKRTLDSATPFGVDWEKATQPETALESLSLETVCVEDRVQYWGEVPDAFNETIFDDAEQSIKYLVLTNTWPKFVRHRQASTISEDDVGTRHDTARLDRENRGR